MSTPTLGQKIRDFRIRSGLSQLDLELELKSGAGSISRVEQGRVNPNRTTIFKIADILKLNNRERQYLLEDNYIEPTEEDIEYAKKQFASLLNSEDSYSYLLDLRSTVIEISKGFRNLLVQYGLNPDSFVGECIIELIFDSKWGLRGNIINEETFPEMALPVLATIVQERKYLVSTQWWKRLYSKLKAVPNFEELWRKANQDEDFDIYGEQSRSVLLNLGEQKIPMVYTMTMLYTDPRFLLLEYKPKP